ncbi:MAG: ZIP family metal transporter [Vicinamibacterales bacterium]
MEEIGVEPSSVALLVTYCVLILVASLAGGWVPLLLRLTHRSMELLVSFVSGVMLGVAILHLLPDALQQRASWLQGQGGGIDPHELGGVLMPVVWWLLAGFLAMFFIERFFCFHHHDVPDANAEPTSDCGHHDHKHKLTWTGAAVGLTVHSLVAGAALAASMQVAEGASLGRAAGLGTFLAIFLHKPFDSMTLGALMAVGRRRTLARHLVNGGFALVVPLGVVIFVATEGRSASGQGGLVSSALAFSAGTFLCISLSDLLPELQFHRHDRLKLSAALLLGLVVAWGAKSIEALGGTVDGAVATPRSTVPPAPDMLAGDD